MAKDPAMLFYTKDWIEGTAELMPSEKGVYIDLLCHQHQKGSIPEDETRLARMVGIPIDEFQGAWHYLKTKFIKKNGRLLNLKLQNVMQERSENSKTNTINGTWASVLTKAKLTKSKSKAVRASFKEAYKEFTDVPKEMLTERLTDWLADWLANGKRSIEDGNENEDASKDKIKFDVFWDLYDKKVKKLDSKKEWLKLDKETQQIILDIIPKYKKSNPDKQYRKDPDKYLSKKLWTDEIIEKETKNGNGQNRAPHIEAEQGKKFRVIT